MLDTFRLDTQASMYNNTCGVIMRSLKKTPRENLTLFGFGAFLILFSIIWILAILYVVAPDQIQPTHEDVRAAYEAFLSSTGSLADKWSLNTVGAVIVKGAALLLLDILFVVARYGGLTLLFLGGYAVFEAVSNPRKAGQ
jgi:hypothetical protein